MHQSVLLYNWTNLSVLQRCQNVKEYEWIKLFIKGHLCLSDNYIIKYFKGIHLLSAMRMIKKSVMALKQLSYYS